LYFVFKIIFFRDPLEAFSKNLERIPDFIVFFVDFNNSRSCELLIESLKNAPPACLFVKSCLVVIRGLCKFLVTKTIFR
jgi:hypothetical protein